MTSTLRECDVSNSKRKNVTDNEVSCDVYGRNMVLVFRRARKFGTIRSNIEGRPNSNRSNTRNTDSCVL